MLTPRKLEADERGPRRRSRGEEAIADASHPDPGSGARTAGSRQKSPSAYTLHASHALRNLAVRSMPALLWAHPLWKAIESSSGSPQRRMPGAGAEALILPISAGSDKMGGSDVSQAERTFLDRAVYCAIWHYMHRASNTNAMSSN